MRCIIFHRRNPIYTFFVPRSFLSGKQLFTVQVLRSSPQSTADARAGGELPLSVHPFTHTYMGRLFCCLWLELPPSIRPYAPESTPPEEAVAPAAVETRAARVGIYLQVQHSVAVQSCSICMGGGWHTTKDVGWIQVFLYCRLHFIHSFLYLGAFDTLEIVYEIFKCRNRVRNNQIQFSARDLCLRHLAYQEADAFPLHAWKELRSLRPTSVVVSWKRYLTSWWEIRRLIGSPF